jgi:hypothetical protein
MGRQNQDPEQLLTEEQARLLLKRASELEARGEPTSYTDLQAAATEAGISPEALQLAAHHISQDASVNEFDKAPGPGGDALSRIVTGTAAIVIGVVVLLVLITLVTFMFWPATP